MTVTYHGSGFVKVAHGETLVAFNPRQKAKFSSNLTLINWRSPEYADASLTDRGDKSGFVIDGPGEYEHSGLLLRGWASPGPEETVNTIFKLVIDEVILVHLGALASGQLAPEVLEELDEVDVLLVPVDGGRLIKPEAAHKLAVGLAPKVIIPVHHGGERDPTLKTFLKEAGAEDATVVDKLSARRRDILSRSGEVLVINPS